MIVSARVSNSRGAHHVTLRTDDNTHTIDIPPKATGFGSSANGGELLFLALATCYCNDIYREAERMGIEVRQVEVEVTGEFGGRASLPPISPTAPGWPRARAKSRSAS